MSEAHHHHHSGPAEETKVSNGSYMFSIAGFMTILLYIVALYLAVATATGFTKREYSQTTIMYAENISSIAAWGILAEFFLEWRAINSNYFFGKISMHKFKIITLLAAILCSIKAVFSIIFLPYNMGMQTTAVMSFYYVGEMAAWLGLSVFLLFYFAKQKTKSNDGGHHHSHHHHHHHSSGENTTSQPA